MNNAGETPRTPNSEGNEEMMDLLQATEEHTASTRALERTVLTSNDNTLSEIQARLNDTIKEGTTRSVHKWRVRWTAELHARFKRAVLKYGIKSAQPRVIQAELEAMGVPNITRTSVASHLQKFRQQAVLLNSLSSTSQLTDAHGAVFPDYVAVKPAVTIKPRNPAPDAAAIRARVLSCVRDPVPTVRDPDRVLGGGVQRVDG
ncbi:Myb-like DNA-binding domain [Carpediemonas membranifera]|uniref:Myb-like DNA-binding domain n=1 Tax=Carpediemonas membranifera TaxID=201153 RepID=A0A8J6AYX7_9EUKA|nr:Myb-like DNA-binding domain [Carpediemonas membranifera]|eukprot:KAG9391833.1 Myb-like DNA-binding domain [Carpediemonas membranifera]